MALDLAPDTLVRAGSGFLFFFAGLVILAVGKGRARPVTLGVLASGFGAYFALANLLPDSTNVAALIGIVPAGAAIVLVCLLPERATARDASIFMAAAALALVGLAGGVAEYLPILTLKDAIEPIILTALLGGAFVLGCRSARANDAAFRREGAVLTLALAPFAAYDGGAALVDSARGIEPLLALAFTGFAVASAAPWIVTGIRYRDTRATFTGLALLSAVVLGGIVFSIIPGGTDSSGIIGILRILGWGVLVHAILRYDLLRVPLPRLAVSRGSVAAIVLATFFIVAQIAQNFLSAQLGLISGGLVAGAMLFAASPIQRAAERMLSGRDAPRAGDRAMTAYRHGLRAALADGAITPAEEEHLAELAETLGIGAATALRLRRDEESKR